MKLWVQLTLIGVAAATAAVVECLLSDKELVISASYQDTDQNDEEPEKG